MSVAGLPKCLGPFETVAAPDVSALAPSSAISFVMQPQQQTNWCWAAVTFSVSHYYPPNVQPVSKMTQCQLASYFFSSKCCLVPMPSYGSSWYGNQQATLDLPLSQAGHLAALPQDPIAFDQVVSEINLKRPVCCRIELPSGGHFVTITGYIADPMMDVLVQDPDPHASSGYMPLAAFAKYKGGCWSQTYLTQ